LIHSSVILIAIIQSFDFPGINFADKFKGQK
jgi:hypothetical protein